MMHKACVRVLAIVSFVLNYAFVIVQTRYPGVLWS